MTVPAPIGWTSDHRVRLLDQSRLPGQEIHLVCSTPEEIADAIRELRVRGAPLLGIAAAMGLTLAVRERHDGDPPAGRLGPAAALLRATRPTAVNLGWALDRMLQRAARSEPSRLHASLVEEARAIHQEDARMCAEIGAAGLPLLGPSSVVMTQCNAGILATGGTGTALAPVYAAHQEGRSVRVIVPETRPLLQGSRLTAWELSRAGVPCTVITDSMAASRLAQGDVTAVVVGADRIAANGDTANKIGTYGLALAARAHRVPFYIAAPRTTFDFSRPDGRAIPVETRDPAEVVAGPAALPGVGVWNPAFDVTPAALVTAFITDAGVLPVEEIAVLR